MYVSCWWREQRERKKAETDGSLCHRYFLLLPPGHDWVHIVHRNKWLWLTGRVQSECRKMFSKSTHLSQLTCPPDMNWEGHEDVAPAIPPTCTESIPYLRCHTALIDWQAVLCEWLAVRGCWGNCRLSDSDQYACYQVKCLQYEWRCYLPGKNNILSAVIPSTMTCSFIGSSWKSKLSYCRKGGQL